MKTQAKRIIAIGLIALTGFSSMIGCGNIQESSKTEKLEEKEISKSKKESKAAKKSTESKKDKPLVRNSKDVDSSELKKISEIRDDKQSTKPDFSIVRPKPNELSKPDNKPKPEFKPSKPDTRPEVKPNKPDFKPKPQHEHKWKERFKTVHHDAVTKKETIHHEAEGHTEKVMVVPERDEKLYVTHWICNQCGADITSDPVGHILNNDDCGGYHSTEVWEGGYIHYDPVYEERWVETKPAWDETKEVVVKPAWDEKVSEGFYCIECGAKR